MKIYGYTAATNATGTIRRRRVQVHGAGPDLGVRAVRWNPGTVSPTELGIVGNGINGVTNAAVFGMDSAGTAIGTVQIYPNGNPLLFYYSAVRWDASGTAARQLAK